MCHESSSRFGSITRVRTFSVPDRPVRLTPLPPWGRPEQITTIIIGVLAFITRFAGLTATTSAGTPIFDEKHYVPQAWDMVESQHNPLIGGIESNPGYGLVVHPPLAKQLIALGEEVFGYTPAGWRVMVALFGCATVLITMALARQLSSSWQVGAIAGFLAVCDGVLLIGSRFGMLDIFQVFFIVTAAWALVKDHRQCAARIFHAWSHPPVRWGFFGPRLGFRWWRFLAGVMLGLSLSVKWSGLYYIAFFGLLSVIGDLRLRTKAGVSAPTAGTLIRDVPAALASLVVLPAALYLWSWRAWFSSETSVYRHALSNGTVPEESWLHYFPESLGSWLYYHLSVLEFHSSLTSSSGHHHPWDSKPWAWLAAVRPILYSSASEQNCWAGEKACHHAIFLFGTPAIWWATVPALLWGLWFFLIRRQRSYGVPLMGFAAGFLPWLAAYDRQMYFFYATALVPFTICLIALACWHLAHTGPAIVNGVNKSGSPQFLTAGGLAVALYLALVAAMFIYFSPILYGLPIPNSWYQSLMWLPSWQ
ncbi:phospholipid carrier-dependent glycosyltransferase [Corynebacterium sp. 3HC-13]|nr:phospholipid carrier-dependent glycosyltransferase [Corynebacterium poyangense]